MQLVYILSSFEKAFCTFLVDSDDLIEFPSRQDILEIY